MPEPGGAGSDVHGIQCTARPDGTDWIVNGTSCHPSCGVINSTAGK